MCRVGKYLLALADPAAGGHDLDEASADHVCHDPTDGGLARAWGSPKDHGRDAVLLDQTADHAVRTYQVLAADIVEGLGAHSVGQWGRLLDMVRLCFLWRGLLVCRRRLELGLS